MLGQAGFSSVIHERAAVAADAPAITHEQHTITYGDLARRIDAAASHLYHRWGVRSRDRVAWLAAADPEQIVLLFALARIGASLLPLNFRLAAPEWDAQFARCRPKLLLHDASFTDAARQLANRSSVECHAAGELAHEHGDPAPELADPGAAALLVFTSGTTGTPKAAVHTQSNLLANMRIAAQVQEMRPEDVVATMLPLFHVGGLCIQTLPALGAGAHVVLLPRFTADAAFDVIEHRRPTLTLQVPATMKALIDHPRWPAADLSSLRAVWAGSSLLPPQMVEAFHVRGVPVCNVYGSTETGPFSIALGPDRAMRKAGSCGHPAPGVQVKLANVQDGTGEVLVRGPNVASTYWPGQSACDEEGWFHTGDLARRDEEGDFTIVGRAKDLIISGGENIHPAEIEMALATHDAVAECAAFGLPDAKWGEVVGVAVVRKPGAVASEDELRAHLESRIARFKLPRRWMLVGELPKTALGKVQRAALARLARDQG
jgi:fatty-acyl-CoA synthase